jgi:hypothetical protein
VTLIYEGIDHPSFSLATGDEAAKPKRARAGRRASIEIT